MTMNMTMNMAEAGAIAELVCFIASGEQYDGQPATAAATATTLAYLADRAEKRLRLPLPRDEQKYAARLEPLATAATKTDEAEDYAATCGAIDTDDFHNWGDSPCSLTKRHKGDHKTWVAFQRDEDGILTPIGNKPDHTWTNRDDYFREIDALHIEWGGAHMDQTKQYELWMRLGRILRKAGA